MERTGQRQGGYLWENNLGNLFGDIYLENCLQAGDPGGHYTEAPSGQPGSSSELLPQ